MSYRAAKFKRTKKRSPREQQEYERAQERRAKLCELYEDLHRRWSGRKIAVSYSNGYYLVGPNKRRVRESTIIEDAERMERELDMQEHMENLSASMEPGTGEDGAIGVT